MASIVAAYTTENGHTLQLANKIAEGITDISGARANLINVKNTTSADWKAMNEAGAIVFGSPTYMGGVSAPFKAFMDATSDFWEDQPWLDKIAAGFTIGSRQSGDKLLTLQHLAIFAAQHGMIWVGQSIIGARQLSGQPRQVNGDGSSLGMMATSSDDKTTLVPSGDEETSVLFGARIAQSVQRWCGQS